MQNIHGSLELKFLLIGENNAGCSYRDCLWFIQLFFLFVSTSRFHTLHTLSNLADNKLFIWALKSFKSYKMFCYWKIACLLPWHNPLQMPTANFGDTQRRQLARETLVMSYDLPGEPYTKYILSLDIFWLMWNAAASLFQNIIDDFAKQLLPFNI